VPKWRKASRAGRFSKNSFEFFDATEFDIDTEELELSNVYVVLLHQTS